VPRVAVFRDEPRIERDPADVLRLASAAERAGRGLAISGMEQIEQESPIELARPCADGLLPDRVYFDEPPLRVGHAEHLGADRKQSSELIRARLGGHS
jgi:hypothetical protein